MCNLLKPFFIKKHKEKVSAFIREMLIVPSYSPPRSTARYCLPIQQGNDNTTKSDYGDSQNSIDTDKFDVTFISKTLDLCFTNQIPPTELSKSINLTFVEKLLFYIKRKGVKEPEVYKAAQIDRRLFSKIISNKEYKPSKDTVLALVFALNLSLEEANDFLDRAGYTLSHSIKRDIILEYFIREKIYDINKINAFLYYAHEKILGRNI